MLIGCVDRVCERVRGALKGCVIKSPVGAVDENRISGCAILAVVDVTDDLAAVAAAAAAAAAVVAVVALVVALAFALAKEERGEFDFLMAFP